MQDKYKETSLGGLAVHAIAAPPELNPGGDDPVIAFVYVETMPDIGSCPGRTNGQLCTNPIGPKDGGGVT